MPASGAVATQDQVAACARHASPAGDDAAAGTSAAPFRTVAKLAASLAPGQTGCLAAGTTFDEQVVIGARGTKSRPIRIASAPGSRRAIVQGTITFQQSAQYVYLERVVVRGTRRADAGVGQVVLAGFGTALIRNDITSLSGRDNSCVVVDHARQARIDSNTIHDCGRAIYGAGILAIVSVGARIENNFVYSNSGDGVALSPNAQLTTVTRNVLYGNDAGVFFGGDARAASSDNKVTRNIISTSTRFSVHAGYRPGERIGRKNVVSGNCLWAAGERHIAGPLGFTATRNFEANPTFADPPRSFLFRTKGRCYPLRPESFRTESKPAPTATKTYPAVRSRLTFAVSAFPSRNEVSVADLGVKEVPRGSRVRFACVRGCSIVDVVAGRGSAVASRRFRNVRFRGTVVIAVGVAKAGYVGAFHRLTLAPTTAAATEAPRTCLPPGKLTGPRPCSSFRIRR
jgi:hypothetical protein